MFLKENGKKGLNIREKGSLKSLRKSSHQLTRSKNLL